MPFQDDRAGNRTGPVPIPGFKPQELHSGPLPADGSLTRPMPTSSSEETGEQFASFVPPTTGQLPSTTGRYTNMNLAQVLTTTLPRVSDGTTSQRMPVVIKGSMKKAAPPPSPLPPASHRNRRMAVTLLGVLMLILITGLALFSATPLGHDMGMNLGPLSQPASGLVHGQGAGLSNLVVQATATAVFHQQTDGLSGGTAKIVGNGAGSLDWPVGQCTYWANYRYHQLTGYWIPWSGNANQWVIGARSAGWDVSQTPHVPSVIVLMGVQGANPTYGHVAVVENIVAGASPETVRTSNMNWYANGGGFDIESYVNFTVGYGVYFVWHP